MFSLVDTPINFEVDCGKGDSFTGRLAKGFKLWMNRNDDMSTRREGKCRAVNTEDPDADDWNLVQSNNS
ncbi:hypothetical protein AAF712_015887 [Marasmius tenuissimus]|uniref:Uncharacterized protein n=1 Tax=Marasmius tenuissimus TaxID=585030 RepID=A0ABR2Z876_9AGAR